jgi:hypothetical protein
VSYSLLFQMTPGLSGVSPNFSCVKVPYNL